MGWMATPPCLTKCPRAAVAAMGLGVKGIAQCCRGQPDVGRGTAGSLVCRRPTQDGQEDKHVPPGFQEAAMKQTRRMGFSKHDPQTQYFPVL